jgi:hypothetical protein
MKYMIMTFGSAEEALQHRSKEWFRGMIAFMRKIDEELVQSGEMVYNEGLVDGSQAKTVRFQNGLPVPTDGPYAEAKESLVGFWLVDVENEARAIEIASKISAGAEAPIEVRRVADGPPEV